MIELGVNVDHVATVRQARRTYEPDPVWAAIEAHLGGADGITVHLREDRRHIQDEDVRRLRELTHIKLNLEMAATDEMVGIAARIKPEMAMLVPEGRQEVTTEGGLDIVSPGEAACARWSPELARCGHRRVGLHRRRDRAGRGGQAHRRLGLRDPHRARTRTPSIPRAATRRARPLSRSWRRSSSAGEAIRALGMRFNAGHALNYFNVQPVAALPGVRELHIGHAIVVARVVRRHARGRARDESA